MLIDLIIPAYNADGTLFKALSSVASQTVSENINVCIVDDCSSCSYDDIIKRFDGILHIEYHRMEKNIGPGNCRQYGIDHTSAPYLMFLDADDLLFNPFSAVLMLDSIDRNALDVVLGDFFECLPGRLENYVHRQDSTWMFGKIYRRSFLEEKGIRFNPDCSYANEDSGFNSMVTMLIGDGKKGYLERPIYIWNCREDSITRKNNREYGYASGFDGFLVNQAHAIDFVIGRGDYYIEELDKYLLADILLCYQMSCECLINADHYGHVSNILSKAKDFYFRYKDKILPLIESGKFFEAYRSAMANVPIVPVSFYDFISLIDDEVDKNELLEKHCALLNNY